jgi:formylglycine-generating enzyme required for sulfatase activity
MKQRTVKSMFAASVIGMSSFAYGAALVPSVTDVTMTQAQDRTVTITYKLVNAPAVVTLDIQTNATDGTWVSIGGENISGVASGVPKGDVWKVVEGDANDTHTITWRPDRSAWAENRVPANGARAVVTAWATNAAPDYMVFDLAATSSQRVSYYPGEAFLPGGLLTNPDYRTTRLVMRKIPANGAVFTMGSVTEASREAANEMIHSATLNNDYYIGVFEVTQSQWMQIMGSNPSAFKVEGAMRPVESVSYQMIRTVVPSSDDAYEYKDNLPENPCEGSFLASLRALSGDMIDFDLPCESEWEYACRAGNGDGYWGDGEVVEVDKYVPGRYMLNQERKQTSSEAVDPRISFSQELMALTPASGTAIAGSYGKNAFGLYDMHGNVYEWCIDMYKADISSANGKPIMASSDVDDSATGGGTRRRQVLRGGSWNNKSGAARSAYRSSAIYNKDLPIYGFRVKCTTGAK